MNTEELDEAIEYLAADVRMDDHRREQVVSLLRHIRRNDLIDTATAYETPIGTRVKLIKEIDNFPVVVQPCGVAGTLINIVKETDCYRYYVKLDDHNPQLDAWDNVIEIASDTHGCCESYIAEL